MTDVTVREKILAGNEAAAAELRARFQAERTLVVNLISSPGSGKTTLLEGTIALLAEGFRLGAIEGDIATERDAERLRRLGVPAHQILTGGGCHLDARQIREALTKTPMPGLDFLFIENVGNLICPTAYNLGEDFKAVVLSVAEGDDKPFKYPGIFASADVAVISKIDLLPHVRFEMEAVRAQIRTLRPDGFILPLSATRGDGMAEWEALLVARLMMKRAEIVASPR
jgi:hydrogenase nickel incorporation protein HypB